MTGRDAYSLFRTPATAMAAGPSRGSSSSRPPPSGGAAAGATEGASVHAEQGGGTSGSTAAAAMISELYAFAADPAGYSSSSSTSSASAGISTRTSIAGTSTTAAGGGTSSVYEAYAARSPSERRSRLTQRVRRSHACLMQRLDRLAATAGADTDTGGASFRDGRFLLWVAAALLHPDGAVFQQGILRLDNGENENGDDDDNIGASGGGADEDDPTTAALSRTLVEALDGMAASVRSCLNLDHDADLPPMLRVLLERNADGVGSSLQRGGGEGGGNGINSDGDDDDAVSLRSYLALPSKIEEALTTGASGGAVGGGGTGTAGGNHPHARSSKRRRLLLQLHGGGYAATGTATGIGIGIGAGGGIHAAKTNPNANAANTDGPATAASTALLAYALAHYQSSDSCPFFVSAPSKNSGGANTDADADDTNHDHNDRLLTWDLLRACTVHAASEMGLVCHLPSVRAGLVCYGLDRLTTTTTSVVMAAADAVIMEKGDEDVNADADGGYAAEQEDDDEGEEDAVNDISGATIDGLSPVTLVELILSDGG